MAASSTRPGERPTGSRCATSRKFQFRWMESPSRTTWAMETVTTGRQEPCCGRVSILLFFAIMIPDKEAFTPRFDWTETLIRWFFPDSRQINRGLFWTGPGMDYSDRTWAGHEWGRVETGDRFSQLQGRATSRDGRSVFWKPTRRGSILSLHSQRDRKSTRLNSS